MFLAPQVGLEPTTLRLTAECSAIELLRNITSKERDDYTAALRFCQPLFYIFFRTKRKDAERGCLTKKRQLLFGAKKAFGL